MRLLFVADGRSPTALNWIAHFVAEGHEVHLLSTYPCRLDLALSSCSVVPVAFSQLAGRGRSSKVGGRPSTPGGERGIRLRAFVRHWLGSLTVRRAAVEARAVIERLRPDLVHAMRIPFEGALAAAAEPPAPLLISVWGNDFTLHASASPGMASLTRRTLRRADALHLDCRRDLRLAWEWGFPENRPSIVLPGNGGVRSEVFHPGASSPASDSPLAAVFPAIPAESPVVVNPRGFRGYVRTETFFRAIPRVLERIPGAFFLCPAMAEERRARAWLDRLDVGGAVHLLPRLAPAEMADVYRRARVSVSPSEHDGTPNTLLEAMACGCLPVVGDLESIREWIEHEVNGLLIDPRDPAALAEAVVRGLTDDGLWERALIRNASLIAERASFDKVMAEAERFYGVLAPP